MVRDFSNDTSALALNTATLGHNLEGHGAGWQPAQIMDACAARGFGGITYWRREVQDAVVLGNATRAAGLAVAGLCRTPFLTGPLALPDDAAIRDDLHASIAMAHDLGAPVLTIVTGGIIPDSHSMHDSLARVTEWVAEVAPLAQQAGVILALEPLNPVYGGDRSCLTTVRDALDICDAVGSDQVQVAIDVYHVWWDTALAEELRRRGRGRIAGFHLCDWLSETRDVLLDRGMMGDGVADLRRLRGAVEAAGYDGFCEVEIFSARNWWLRPPTEVLDVIIQRFKSVC